MDHVLHTIDAIQKLRLELWSHGARASALEALPEGATLRAIAASERRIGCRLPQSYRTFLHAHDGFPSLLHGARLFGTGQLGRREDAAMTAAVFAAYHTPLPEIGPPARPEGRSDAMIPFGMDAEGTAIFAWNPAVLRANGEMEIIVWANGLGDRCGGFPEFLTLIHDMLLSEIGDARADLLQSA